MGEGHNNYFVHVTVSSPLWEKSLAVEARSKQSHSSRKSSQAGVSSEYLECLCVGVGRKKARVQVVDRRQSG